MKLFKIDPDISLIGLKPPVAGFDDFLGTYVIQSGKTALVDVGPRSTLPTLLDGLAVSNIKPDEIDYILCTHIHLDHSGAVGHALKHMPKASCVVHVKGIYHMASPAKLWQSSLQTLGQLANDYGEPEPISPSRLIEATEGLKIDLGDIVLDTMLTPGHAAHHVSFLDRQNGRLFSGEAAGIYFADLGCGRPATPIPFDLEKALCSIEKLIDAGPSKNFYSHFGAAPRATEQLKLYKNQLSLWAEIISDYTFSSVEWQKILDKLTERDNSLYYLNKLSVDRLRIELDFIKNAIYGIKSYFAKNEAK